MKIQKDLKYAKSHEWVKYEEGGTALIGLSDYAQKELGDLVFINLPEEGDDLEAGEPFGDVESVKAVSDIFSPFTAKIIAVNEELLDSPQRINTDPYEAWFVKVENITDEEELISAEEYEAYLEEL